MCEFGRIRSGRRDDQEAAEAAEPGTYGAPPGRYGQGSAAAVFPSHPAKPCLYSGHAYSPGIEFVKRFESAVAVARPSHAAAVLRGLQRRCPACGVGASLRGYLKVRDACGACGQPLGHIRADDIPPYMTIFLVGHLIVPLVLWAERHYSPPLWAQMVGWPLLTLLLTLLFLPFVKGAVVGLMWSLGLNGSERQ